MKFPKPSFRPAREVWYVTLDPGGQLRLWSTTEPTFGEPHRGRRRPA